MNHELGLRVLSQIMEWSDEEARREFRWLTFMSYYKYDDYRDYLSGVRFLESLATWLQQFEFQDRHIAYQYIKNKLIYISPAEMQRLIEKFFPEIVQRHLVTTVSNDLGISKHKVWSSRQAIEEFEWQTRKTLFMGASDGARIDALRRANIGIISNEQVVVSTQIDETKWKSLIKDLRVDLENKRPGQGKNGKFSRIYLLDDFIASGTSLIRYNKDEDKYKGKLARFYESLDLAKANLCGTYGDFLEEDWELIIHHYIGTEGAERIVNQRYKDAIAKGNKWTSNAHFTISMRLPEEICLNNANDHGFVDICKKYYDPFLEKGKHPGESGNSDMTFGFGQCALPVVLEHNTPNNSLPLLWAETSGSEMHHAMRPLFRRRQRHSD